MRVENVFLIILIILCYTGSGMISSKGEMSSNDWAFSEGDEIYYSRTEMGNISETNENATLDMNIWKKEDTDWGTERIWLEGSAIDEVRMVWSMKNMSTRPERDYFCLDSIGGSVNSAINTSLFDPSTYEKFNPYHAIAKFDPAFYIIPINSERFDWDSKLNYANTTETWNTSVFINETIDYTIENYSSPAIKISAIEEKIQIFEDINTSTYSTFKTKNCQYFWYSNQLGILLQFSQHYEFWSNISFQNHEIIEYEYFLLMLQLHQCSKEKYLDPITTTSTPLFITSIFLTISVLCYKKKGRRT
ncbi:MAG: hypothetical protein ACFFAU_14270 [Candidatus Hodarchaeota archaeon]